MSCQNTTPLSQIKVRTNDRKNTGNATDSRPTRPCGGGCPECPHRTKEKRG